MVGVKGENLEGKMLGALGGRLDVDTAVNATAEEDCSVRAKLFSSVPSM
jgi:hypothetical protein